MEIGLIVLALMLATLLGWLLKQTFNTQPWVTETVGDTAHHGPLGDSSGSKLIALITLLAVVTSFFALSGPGMRLSTARPGACCRALS